MKIQAALASLCLVALVLQPGQRAFAQEAGAAPLQTIAALDVPRYMGTWYEIAKYPNWFQKKCVSDTSAEYRAQADGRVQVINRCREASGDISEAVGMASQVGGADSPRLEVRFAPAWLSFLPLVWGDYWVVEIDDDYQWVVVSEPSRRFLWVLARKPALDARIEASIRARLIARGFDPDRLVSGRQDDGG